MREELEKKLFEKYPKIFRQKDLDMKQTCMCWGIEHGDGWYTLIDQLCKAIQSYIDGNPWNIDMQIEATQVKEKFGELRFYYDWRKAEPHEDHKRITDKNRGESMQLIEGMIWFAQYMSYTICEVCGHPGKPNGGGWIRTLCDEHRKEKG